MITNTTNSIISADFFINERKYKLKNKPIAILCLDGCSNEYLDASLAKNCIPNIAKMLHHGYRCTARGALPSFTNVNNASIVTGLPPSGHGISGNFFLDPKTGKEVMMNSAHYLRASTILASAAKIGRRVAMVTAKEKLRDILSHDLDGIRFSAEKANMARIDTQGIEMVEEFVGYPIPEIYSAEASLFVLRAGAALLEKNIADFVYLSTTDYIQHVYSPDTLESLEFYSHMDYEIGRIMKTGATIGITADHGMNAKHKADGSPNVVYLENILQYEFGESVRVICPITDPYVKHHGALGSLVIIHLSHPKDPKLERRIEQRLKQIEGVTEVYDHNTAVEKLELPDDRTGQFNVMSSRNFVLGKTSKYHDLTALDGPLRSHGGRYEEKVPLITSKPLTPEYIIRSEKDPRNFDVFDFTINGTEQ